MQKDFAQQTLQLAQFLGISERYAASLLQVGVAGRSRWGRTAIEVSCLLYYREKLALLACLKDLLSGLNVARQEQTNGTEELSVQMERFLRSVVATDVAGTSVAGKASFTRRLVQEIDNTANQIQAHQQNLQTGNQGASQPAHDELVLEVIELLKQQSRDLGHVLHLLAVSNLLGADDVLAITKWLQEITPERFGTSSIYILIPLLAALDPSAAAADDSTFVRSYTSILESKNWKTDAIRAAAALQWSLVLVDRLKHTTGSVTDLRLQEEKTQVLIMGAIRSGVFAFLNLNVAAFRHEQETDELWSSTAEEDEVKAQTTRSEIDPVFQEYILEALQRLTVGVTTVMLPILRKLQRAEEDAAFASSRGRADAPAQRHDIQQLFDLIATLCRGRADAGLDFWVGRDGRTTRFLLWAADSRESGHQQALLEMLAAMAAGPESAMQAHNLLSNSEIVGDRLISWQHLFGWIQHYIEQFTKSSSTAVSSLHHLEMPPDEANLLIAFLQLLRNVAFHSKAARWTLFENNEYQTISRLFRLSLCHIHLQLKAALLDALAAFARDDHAQSDRITDEIWNQMTKADLLGSGKARSTGFLAASHGAYQHGAIHALEQIEAPQRNYVATCSLIHFLTAILPQRTEAVDEYVQFVIDKVFLQAPSREYDQVQDRWKVNSACLCFFSRSLDKYRLEELATGARSSESFALPPGFLVLKQILTGTALTKELFAIASTGFETVNAASRPLLTTSVRLALQCVRRTFDVQDVFLQVLLPAFSASSTDRIGPPARYTSLDQQLLQTHQTVVDIALYINADSDSLARISTQVLGQIASSAAFSVTDRFSLTSGRKQVNRLVGLLEMTDESARLRSGYIERLNNPERARTEKESNEDVAGSRRPLRTIIVDFLISHVGTRAPNIAHLLLGFDVTADTQVISDPDSPTSTPGALHAILALLSVEDGALDSVLTQFPTLTERCLQLLLKLCSEPFSSAATLRYLRTREDFLATRLPLLPLVPLGRSLNDGTAVFPNGLAIPTTVGTALSNLRMKADMLSMAALEIHALTSDGMMSATAPILALLLDSEEGVGIRLLELVASFDFDWNDLGDDVGQELSLLGDLNVDLTKNSAGTEQEFNLNKAANLLSAARAELQRSGALRDAAQSARFEEEATIVMRYLAARNAHSSIRVARQEALRAWKNALDMILTRCTPLLRSEDRIVVLFDCLSSVLPRITGSTDSNTVELLSGSVLALIASLRLTTAEQKNALPGDRLLGTLKALVSAILQPGTSTVARGSLYSALINFLSLTASSDTSSAAVVDDDAASVASYSSVQGRSVHVRARALVAEKAEKLAILVMRDALDASDVWKTVAYTLMEKLAAIEGSRSRGARVLHVLSNQGYLKTMVASLREMDLPLQDTLRPDPPTLTPTYVYEAMFAFAIRLASSKAGAEALIESRILETLAQADFLAATPDQGLNAMEMDTFLPTARERHAALTAPALELAIAIFSTTTSAMRPLLTLLNAQQESFAAALAAPLQEFVTLTQVNLAYLLVALLALRAVSSESGSSTTESSSFHTHVLSLSAAFLGTEDWKSRIVPSTDTEREESAVRRGFNGDSIFSRKAATQVEKLQKSLLIYLEAASGRPRVRPVLAPLPHVQQEQPQTFYQRNTNVASLGSFLLALDQAVQTLTSNVAYLDALTAALEQPKAVTLDDWEEVRECLLPQFSFADSDVFSYSDLRQTCQTT